ncbi:GDSL esterase/lipase [Forsythia ovata]|uniref:GDSL esterase/lipase n=1 Tax=Forsythia ovata TaxID=205694 RepID=A0ABD1WH03_9LAMI
MADQSMNLDLLKLIRDGYESGQFDPNLPKFMVSKGLEKHRLTEKGLSFLFSGTPMQIQETCQVLKPVPGKNHMESLSLENHLEDFPMVMFSRITLSMKNAASFLDIRSPIPYAWKVTDEKWIKNGMNFAIGGTGVFKTLVDQPNMTAQINFFQQLIQKKVYTSSSSIALVSLAGNDYATYFAKNGSMEGTKAFTKSVIDQLVLNLKHIHGVGVQKVAVTGIVPFGCLPSITSSISYKQCKETVNNIAKFHNQLLQQSLQRLNNETGASSVFILLDLYHAFSSALKLKQDHPGK